MGYTRFPLTREEREDGPQPLDHTRAAFTRQPLGFQSRESGCVVDDDLMIGGEKRGQLSAFVGAERPCVPGVYAADLFAARKREGFD